MNFNQTGSDAGNSSLQQRLDERARREKQRADGKSFWLFKRSAIWLTAVLLMFGTASFLFPGTIRFQSNQIFIAVFMFGGYFVGSLKEWGKMERMFQPPTVISE